jgi:hypothetical protein
VKEKKEKKRTRPKEKIQPTYKTYGRRIIVSLAPSFRRSTSVSLSSSLCLSLSLSLSPYLSIFLSSPPLPSPLSLHTIFLQFLQKFKKNWVKG